MGSTSYIIPLRSESDEDAEREPIPQLEPIIFKNKVAPKSSPEIHTEPVQPRINQSRSPLFRAKSKEYDTSLSETETTTACHPPTELFIKTQESGAAKIKRSIFRNKSNSAGASIVPASSGITGLQKPNRSTSAKTLKRSK